MEKLDILYTQLIFLPKPGLKEMKQVHLYTKWSAVVPHPYKAKICSLPSNKVIKMVLKNRKPRKKKATRTDKTSTLWFYLQKKLSLYNEYQKGRYFFLQSLKHQQIKQKSWKEKKVLLKRIKMRRMTRSRLCREG